MLGKSPCNCPEYSRNCTGYMECTGCIKQDYNISDYIPVHKPVSIGKPLGSFIAVTIEIFDVSSMLVEDIRLTICIASIVIKKKITDEQLQLRKSFNGLCAGNLVFSEL